MTIAQLMLVRHSNSGCVMGPMTPAAMDGGSLQGKIFINYRRGDDPGHTGRLFDYLQDAFQPDQLFMDVDSVRRSPRRDRPVPQRQAPPPASSVMVVPRSTGPYIYNYGVRAGTAYYQSKAGNNIEECHRMCASQIRCVAGRYRSFSEPDIMVLVRNYRDLALVKLARPA
jgi:hypothetical protein